MIGKILETCLPRVILDLKAASAPARVRAALDALSVDAANVISTTHIEVCRPADGEA